MDLKNLKSIVLVVTLCLSITALADSIPGENNEPEEDANPDEIVVTALGKEFDVYFSHWGVFQVFNPDLLSAQVSAGLNHYSNDREFFAKRFSEELMLLTLEDRQYVVNTIATLFESLDSDKAAIAELKTSASSVEKVRQAFKILFGALNHDATSIPTSDQKAHLERVKKSVETSSETFSEYVDQIFEVVSRAEKNNRYLSSQKSFFSKMIKNAGKF
jgi:hypothetical protein